MASPHTGSLNQQLSLCGSRPNLFNVYIQGKPFHPTVETLGLHRDHDGQRVDARFHLSYPYH